MDHGATPERRPEIASNQGDQKDEEKKLYEGYSATLQRIRRAQRRLPRGGERRCPHVLGQIETEPGRQGRQGRQRTQGRQGRQKKF